MVQEIDPVLSVARTVQRGALIAQGTDGAYFRLRHDYGESRLRRLELAPDAPNPRNRTSLLHFAQITDLHLVDTQSPGRYEFMDHFHGGPDILHLVLPACRPQETLALHACEMTVRALNRVGGSSETGAPLQFVITTGDNTDNCQWNELTWFAKLMAGGEVAANSGGPHYEGVQSRPWNDPHYWHPDPCRDRYKHKWGFPEYPGLLEEALQPFCAEGAQFPWLSCYGNHDALILGTAPPNSRYEEIVTGSSKNTVAPPNFNAVRDLPSFDGAPETFLTSSTATVTPDTSRRPYSKREFVAAHLQPGGAPEGHGFDRANLERGSADYAYDAGAVRLIALDTTNPNGYYQGSIGLRQYRWFKEQLVAAHSRYFAADGSLETTGNPDRLVVLCTHHPLIRLTNSLVVPNAACSDDGDPTRVLGDEIASLVHRFPNVILWINGHTHCNTIRPRPDQTGRTIGFWEVTTSSIIDWPSQARLIEIVSNGDETLSILCTMVDHDGPPDPGSAEGVARLASIHRELAANDPHAGVNRGLGGQPGDRTVDLVIPAPFRLD
ncbi:MAG: TIGR03767 family metallophosphoesterase [Chloroflexota bacterium]